MATTATSAEPRISQRTSTWSWTRLSSIAVDTTPMAGPGRIDCGPAGRSSDGRTAGGRGHGVALGLGHDAALRRAARGARRPVRGARALGAPHAARAHGL